MPRNEEYLAINCEEHLRLMQKYSATKYKLICVHAMDILVLLWFNQGGRPFYFDPLEISKKIRDAYPHRRVSAKRLGLMKGALLSDFFEELPDGRWVPNQDVWYGDFEPRGEA